MERMGLANQILRAMVLKIDGHNGVVGGSALVGMVLRHNRDYDYVLLQKNTAQVKTQKPKTVYPQQHVLLVMKIDGQIGVVGGSALVGMVLQLGSDSDFVVP